MAIYNIEINNNDKNETQETKAKKLNLTSIINKEVSKWSEANDRDERLTITIKIKYKQETINYFLFNGYYNKELKTFFFTSTKYRPCKKTESHEISNLEPKEFKNLFYHLETIYKKENNPQILTSLELRLLNKTDIKQRAELGKL